MDALELLKTDHKTVKDLFKKVEASKNDKQQKQLFEEIKMELETHTHIEETVFYPAVAKHDEI
jgi:hemerythrin superfamily protein